MNVVTLEMGAGSSLRGPLDGKRVLLVEDSATAASIMARQIRGAGGRFRRADGVEAALRHLRSFRPDILIVDPGLPDGNGLDLIEQVSQAKFARPQIIVLSGSDLEEEALIAGADAFLMKPVGRVQLLATLARGPVSTTWQQVGGALTTDLTESLVTDLRRAQLSLLEAKLSGRDADDQPFGMTFLRVVLDLSEDDSLQECRDAVAGGQADVVLKALKNWLSKADPMDIHGEVGPPLFHVSH